MFTSTVFYPIVTTVYIVSVLSQVYSFLFSGYYRAELCYCYLLLATGTRLTHQVQTAAS